MRKITFIIVGFLALTFSQNTWAERGLAQHFGDYDSCYARQYTPKHLADNPKQTVAYIRIDHTPSKNEYVKYDPISGDVEFSIKVHFVDSNKTYRNSGSCRPKNDKLICNIECDGGGFDIKSKNTDSILISTGENGFAVSGCGIDDIRFITRETDDKVFLLNKLPSNQCKSFNE